MVLTKEELIASLQNEVRILLHLASKIDRNKLDYRPTPKQRSTKELLQYLVVMGPMLVRAIKAGAFDRTGMDGRRQQKPMPMNFDQILAAIEKQRGIYAELLAGFSDADFRGEIDLFGAGKSSQGSVLVNLVLGGPRGISDAVVPVPQGVRPRRTQHDESVGRRGCPDARYVSESGPALREATTTWLTRAGEGILKLDESCISNSKLEISDWTDYRADWPVQSEISSFEFEMQDSSNFKISLSLMIGYR